MNNLNTIKQFINDKKMQEYYTKALHDAKEHHDGKEIATSELIKHLRLMLVKINRRIQDTEDLIVKIKRKAKPGDFRIFYSHYVEGLTLNETAKRYKFTKSGVTKVLRKVRALIID